MMDMVDALDPVVLLQGHVVLGYQLVRPAGLKSKLDPELLERASSQLIVMHPMPRDIEIPSEIDGTPHARYFDQVRNGVPLRMAILTALLGRADRRVRDD